MKIKSVALIFLLGLILIATTSALEFGVGWSATFYDNTTFGGSAAATINNINGLNFIWSGRPNINGANVANVGENNFSARFSSTQNFTQGNYQFSITYDDNVRVILDGTNIFEDFGGGPVKTRTVDRAMTAGAHSLTVEFVEISADAVLQFQWFLGGSGGVVPTTGPTPTPGPTNTPPPTGLPPLGGGLTATVIRATVLNARTGPYVGAERTGRLLRGQTYNVIGRDHNARWFLLQLSDRQAWAFGYYLAVNGNEFNAPVVSSFVTQGNPAAQTGVVAVAEAGLKLRAAPTINSEQIGRIIWGAILPVTGRTGGDGAWWRVIWKGTEGWVFSPYLRLIEGEISDVPTIQ
jgi:uncharacterized protein YraI